MSRLDRLIFDCPPKFISNITRVKKLVLDKSYRLAAELLQGLSMMGNGKWFDECNHLAIIYHEHWILCRGENIEVELVQ